MFSILVIFSEYVFYIDETRMLGGGKASSGLALNCGFRGYRIRRMERSRIFINQKKVNNPRHKRSIRMLVRKQSLSGLQEK